MKLQEYQSKRIFAQYGVPVPEGGVANTPREAREIAQRLRRPVVVKAQVLVGGRGKAGGIKLAETPGEAEAVAAQILDMDLKGLSVGSVLIERAAEIASGVAPPGMALRPLEELELDRVGWDEDEQGEPRP